MKQLISRIMHLGWIEMLERVIPNDTHPDLVKTYKRFYYAGGQRSVHALVYDAALDEGDELSSADMSKLDALMHELNEYFADVAAGRQ